MGTLLMDCTLRDGANVVGHGFDKEITGLVLSLLTNCGVPIIEFGNAGGIGAYELSGYTKAETDETYLQLAQTYLGEGSQLGMFLNAKRLREENVALAARYGMSFLRVGADAGDAQISIPAVQAVKKAGMKAYYSLMKAYLLSPQELAREARTLEQAGVDLVTIMDSAGTMLPEETGAYVRALKDAVSIPVAFHGHNNLGLSAANGLAAYENGADVLDCGLMGMARSAGNLPTEVCVAMLQRLGAMQEIDLYGMLDRIDRQLAPAMEKHGYRAAITPLELILGMSGCHSSFVKNFRAAAQQAQVNLYRLIVQVSAQDRKSPSQQLIAQVAESLKQ